MTTATSQRGLAPFNTISTVAIRELRDIWLGGRGPIIILGLSILLTVITFLAATNKELNLLDQKGTVNLLVQLTMFIGVALTLLVSADAFSGQRENETLEGLLLTPAPRRDIRLGSCWRPSPSGPWPCWSHCHTSGRRPLGRTCSSMRWPPRS